MGGAQTLSGRSLGYRSREEKAMPEGTIVTAAPRRSCLYMPGANPKALEKAKTLPADVLIFDLEDSVAPEAKAEARETVRRTLALGGYSDKEIVIRVNALGTPWGVADVRAACEVGPAAILFPKIDGPEDIAKARDVAASNGGERIALWAMIETPLSILNVAAIAANSEQANLRAFVMGANDLAKDLRCAHTQDRAPLLTALSMTVLAARAYGLVPIDGVYNDIQNEDGFAAVCRQGLGLGFEGKTLIHPSQIALCNAIFAPTEAELAFARAVITAFAAPENAGKGVLKVDGKMTELLHLEQAKRAVAIAEAIAAKA
jgi:citrate lyase subunit beta/citryl-CoA lyase